MGLISGGEGTKVTCWPHLVPPSPLATRLMAFLVFVSAAPVHQLIQIENPQEGIVTWKT